MLAVAMLALLLVVVAPLAQIAMPILKLAIRPLLSLMVNRLVVLPIAMLNLRLAMVVAMLLLHRMSIALKRASILKEAAVMSQDRQQYTYIPDPTSITENTQPQWSSGQDAVSLKTRSNKDSPGAPKIGIGFEAPSSHKDDVCDWIELLD